MLEVSTTVKAIGRHFWLCPALSLGCPSYWDDRMHVRIQQITGWSLLASVYVGSAVSYLVLVHAAICAVLISCLVYSVTGRLLVITHELVGCAYTNQSCGAPSGVAAAIANKLYMKFDCSTLRQQKAWLTSSFHRVRQWHHEVLFCVKISHVWLQISSELSWFLPNATVVLLYNCIQGLASMCNQVWWLATASKSYRLFFRSIELPL